MGTKLKTLETGLRLQYVVWIPPTIDGISLLENTLVEMGYKAAVGYNVLSCYSRLDLDRPLKKRDVKDLKEAGFRLYKEI